MTEFIQDNWLVINGTVCTGLLAFAIWAIYDTIKGVKR